MQIIDVEDTWGVARSAGRTHEGTDIVVPRGTLVLSATDAVITRIETTGGGGLVIWTRNPGNEQFYYAHLEGIFPDIKVGDYVKRGDPIAFVGNSGNAIWTDPHLHLGIYSMDWVAENPYPRITETFSEQEKINALVKFLEYLQKLIKEKTKL